MRDDLSTRRVSRRTVGIGVTIQFVVFMVLGVAQDRPWLALTALASGLTAALIQCSLALLRPGSLGFGDVTASLLIGQMVAVFGLETFIIWWLIMGMLGMPWVWAWTRWRRRVFHDDGDGEDREDAEAHAPYHDTVPFVPVIVCASILAISLIPIYGYGMH